MYKHIPVYRLYITKAHDTFNFCGTANAHHIHCISEENENRQTKISCTMYNNPANLIRLFENVQRTLELVRF